MRWLALLLTMHDDSSHGGRELEEEELSDIEDGEDAQDSLLRSSRHKAREPQGKNSYEMTSKGRLRAYWLGVVVCIGGFLCKTQTVKQYLLGY